MRPKTKQQRNKQRYNLHYLLKKEGFVVYSRKKIIGVPPNLKENLTPLQKKWLTKLESQKYGLQLEMF